MRYANSWMFLLVVTLLTITALSPQAHAKVTQVFIVAGQSNALGSASSSGLPAELRLQPDVRFWFDTNRGNSRGAFQDLAAIGSFGPEINVGRVLADHLDDEVAIIKVAQGGTTLEQLNGKTDWSVDSSGELYDRLIRNVNLATAKIVSRGDTPHVAGLFWMQGESDGYSSGRRGRNPLRNQPAMANAYESNLTRFVAGVRNNLNVPALPFFIGEVKIEDDPSILIPESDYNTPIGQWNYTPTIQAAERAVAAADPHAYFIPTQEFSQIRKDFVHFDQAGQLALGEAFAKAYLATVPEPSNCCLLLVCAMAVLGRPRMRLSPRVSMFLLGITVMGSVAEAKVTQVFIVAGQSNGSGRARSKDLPAKFLVQPDVRFWFDTDYGSTRGAFQDLTPQSRYIGPEINLGRVLADSLEDEVTIIKVSQGGTTLAPFSGRTDWSPDSPGELYDKLIRNVNEATAAIISRGDTPQLAGMFWMQGESDGKSSGGGFHPPQPVTANAYEGRLTEFIAKVRGDLSHPELPFFIGEINIGDNPAITVPESNYNTSFGAWDYTPTIQTAEAAVAAADPRVHFVGTQEFSLLPDFLHFDQAGQLDLGEAFAKSYLATVPEPSSCCLLLVSVITLFGFKRSH